MTLSGPSNATIATVHRHGHHRSERRHGGDRPGHLRTAQRRGRRGRRLHRPAGHLECPGDQHGLGQLHHGRRQRRKPDRLLLHDPVYQGQSGTLTFTPGVTTQVVRVPLLNCGTSLSTGFYTFYLNLSGNSGGLTRRRRHPDRRHGRQPGRVDAGPVRQERRGRRQRRHGPGAGAPRRALGLSPGPAGHGELHHRERLGRVGHRLHQRQRHLTFPAGETAQSISVPITRPTSRRRPGASR